MLYHSLKSAVLVSVFFLASFASAQQEYDVSMADGVTLKTVVYLPAEGGPSWPVMLERTPYPRGGKATGWTELGVAYVEQSFRGRFGSGGEFRPFADEGWGQNQDGAATVAWITSQDWCNGKIGVFGGSGPGIAAILLAGSTQELMCFIDQDAACNFTDHLSYQGGVFRKSLVEGWMAFGVQTPEYAAVWKSHAPDDAYWKHYDTAARAALVTAPGLHVGGWWDIFARGTIDLFVALQERGGEGAKGNQKLVMRPGGHGPWGAQSLQFPENFEDFRVTPYRKQFVQHWLAGDDNGMMNEPAVNYYTVGDDKAFDGPGWEWRTAETWPPFETIETAYCLTPGKTLSAAPPALADGQLTFTFDPSNPVPTTGGQNLVIPYGPFDQREVGQRADVLRFVSEPLAEPLEGTGHFRVQLYVSTDAPDTDFTAKLVDIYPAGDDREILMLDSIQRLKYSGGKTDTNNVSQIEIDLGHISWIFNTGHRIGVHISSSNYPRFEVNPNTGSEFPPDGFVPGQQNESVKPEESPRPAHNTVYMSEKYPSALFIPRR